MAQRYHIHPHDKRFIAMGIEPFLWRSKSLPLCNIQNNKRFQQKRKEDMKVHDKLKNEQSQIQETIHLLKQQEDWARLEKFLMACVETYPKEYYFLTELSSV